jgi:hypothetical protein
MTSLKDQIIQMIATKATGRDFDLIEELGKMAGIAECAKLFVPLGALTQDECNEIEDAAASLIDSIEYGSMVEELPEPTTSIKRSGKAGG